MAINRIVNNRLFVSPSLAIGKQQPTSRRALNVGEKVVLKLAESLPTGSTRIITADNFFSSSTLCKSLLSKNIRFVGTLRSNKTFIPPQFKAKNTRAIFNSIFGFNRENNLILASYVPKKSKAVLLISTLHTDFKIKPDCPKLKPEIIHFYNENKFGVDVLDQKIEKNTVRRKTNRWTFNVFMWMIDTAAQNAYSLDR